MNSMDYGLDYAPNDLEADVQLNDMQADPEIAFDTARLLRVLINIAHRGPNAREENVHLFWTKPPLHLIVVGKCAAFYAYGPSDQVKTMYLLGFCKKTVCLEKVTAAEAILKNIK